jgi:hypothetical protein
MGDRQRPPNRLEHSGGERDTPSPPAPTRAKFLDGAFWTSPTEPRRLRIVPSTGLPAETTALTAELLQTSSSTTDTATGSSRSTSPVQAIAPPVQIASAQSPLTSNFADGESIISLFPLIENAPAAVLTPAAGNPSPSAADATLDHSFDSTHAVH